MRSGSLNLATIVTEQKSGWGLLGWNLIPLFPMFLVYFVAAVAETNRAPFDVAEGESEIVAGFHVEYSGTAFAVFFLAEYANMFAISLIASALFLGGWDGPLLPPFVWMIVKAQVLVFVMMWVRSTLPRLRYDQLMHFAWKRLLPLSLINIGLTGVGVAVVRGMVR